MLHTVNLSNLRELEDADLRLLMAMSLSEMQEDAPEGSGMGDFWSDLLRLLEGEKRRRRLAIQELERLYFRS